MSQTHYEPKHHNQYKCTYCTARPTRCHRMFSSCKIWPCYFLASLLLTHTDKETIVFILFVYSNRLWINKSTAQSLWQIPILIIYTNNAIISKE